MTGAGGLLGRHVVAGWHVSSGDLIPVGRRFEGRDIDLSRPQDARAVVQLVRPDVILHLVGGPHAEASQLYTRNVLAGLNVLEAVAERSPMTQVVLVGSAAEYGGGWDRPIPEDAPLEPLSEYGRAKAAQTRLAQAVAARDGVSVTVLRPFNVVAPDMPSSSALGNLRRQLLAADGPRRRVVCGRTDVRRDYVAADAVAEVMRVLVVDPPGGVLNVCSGTSTSIGAVLEVMCRQLGVEAEVELDPRLASLPAGDVVVGHPGRLHALGLVLDGSAEHVGRVVLGDWAVA